MNLINKLITGILNPLIGLMFVIAVAVFIWGIVEFIWNAGNEEKRTSGKKHIIWGLVGLFIMLAVGAIIEIINNFVHSF
jgi:heme A synthase